MFYYAVIENGNVIGLRSKNFRYLNGDEIEISEELFKQIESKGVVNNLGMYNFVYNAKKKKIEEVDFSEDEEYLEKLRLEKLKKLRSIRDELLNKTDWIQSYLDSEREAILQGFLDEKNRRFKKEEIYNYLQWKQTMRDLPQIIDIDKYTLEDINPNNTNIFPSCPIGTYSNGLLNENKEVY